MDRIRICSIGLALVFAAACAPATASAAPEPGSPVPVAPGVPSHGRAWELTTSPDPSAASFWGGGILISADGNAISYRVAGVLPGYPLVNPPIFSTAFGRRGPNGWTVTHPAVPSPEYLVANPEDLKFPPKPLVFGADHEKSIWQTEVGHHENGLFLRDQNGEYSLLIKAANLLAASPDLQRVVFASDRHLLPADADRLPPDGASVLGESLYELEGSKLRLLDVFPDGSLLSNCGSRGDAVSTDARRVYFTTRFSCPGPARVYLAEGDAPPFEISASRCTSDCGPQEAVSFVGATPSGSSAFLVSAEKLTDDDVDSDRDLYRYDASDDDLVLISTGSGSPDLIPTQDARVQSSADGSRVYFYAAEATGPQAGVQGLYMADADGPQRVLTTAGSPLVQLSANGRYAVLSVEASLLPGDTDVESDVYRYDAVDGSLVLLSAGSVGGNGPFSAAVTPSSLQLGQSDTAMRAMSDDGGRIFFTSDERLVPEDTNTVSDVYEWAFGSLGLVSSGTGTRSAELVGSSTDGSTVFFETAETLLPSDRDGGEDDYYAARIGGGFAEGRPSPSPCPCPGSTPRERTNRAPASATTVDRIQLGPIGAAERRRIVATGWIALLAEVPRGGRLSAEARAQIGRRPRSVASTTVSVPQPGPLQLKMRLSKTARNALARGGDLQVHLRLHLSSLDAIRRVSFELEGTR